MSPGDDKRGPRDSRGQLGFDFLVGMSIFLITVAFVIGFIPGMFDPFTSSSGANMIVADRSAAHLVGNALVESPTEIGVLNATCTVAFFNQSTPSGCRFDSTELSSALGVGDATSINVTIEDAGSIREVDSVTLNSGQVPSDLDDVSVAQRAVHLDGNTSRLFVRVW